MLTISTVNGLNRGVTCNTVVRDKELTLMIMMLKLLLPLQLLHYITVTFHTHTARTTMQLAKAQALHFV